MSSNLFKLMKFSNNLSEIASSIRTIAEIGKFEKEYPEDYLVFHDLGTLMPKAGLDRNKVPDIYAWASTRRTKGFSMKDMQFVLSIFPDTKNILVAFLPDVFVHEGYKFPASDFLVFLNNKLPIGSVSITGTQKKGIMGKESLTFSYSVSMSYENIKRPNKALLANMLRNALDVAYFLPPALEQIQSLASGEEAFKKVQITSKENKPSPVRNGSALISDVINFFQSEGYSINTIPKGSTTISFSGGTKEPFQRFVHVTAANQIIFETQLETLGEIKSQSHRESVARFIDIANTEAARLGKLTLDIDTKIVSYKTSVDLLGVENEMSASMLKSMISENNEMSNLFYLGANEVLVGSYPRDVFDKIMGNGVVS